MNIFSEKVTCDVCGGPGVAMPGTAARGWFKGTSIRHSDPRVCAEHLAQRKAELDQREKSLNQP